MTNIVDGAREIVHELFNLAEDLEGVLSLIAFTDCPLSEIQKDVSKIYKDYRGILEGYYEQRSYGNTGPIRFNVDCSFRTVLSTYGETIELLKKIKYEKKINNNIKEDAEELIQEGLFVGETE